MALVRKLIPPFLLLAHAICVLVYYLVPTDIRYYSFGWAVYFHCVQCFFLSLFSIIPKNDKVTFQFQIVEFVFSGLLGIAFVANYYELIENPHGLIITSLTIVVTTLMIITAGIRHGLFND